ncbi:MAG: hypothetical protein M1275_02025 [Patescibacteria group bacterium]|nr:hypothetical protein [Patescibacteria group bacterium]
MTLERREPYRILLVPFPMTALAAFGYYLLAKLGLVNESTHVCYHRHPRERTSHRILNGTGLRLFGHDLTKRVSELLARCPAAEQPLLKRYCRACLHPQSVRNFGKLLTQFLLSNNTEPGEVLTQSAKLFERLLQRGTEPETVGARQFASQQVIQTLPSVAAREYPTSSRFITLARFQTPGLRSIKITGKRQLELAENRLGLLEGQHVAVVMCGPPNSGKSSSLASLAVCMQDEVDSLRSRPGWGQLGLSAEYLDLDLASPSAKAVYNMDAEGLRVAATARLPGGPWTVGLALKALDMFMEARKRVNVLLVDLPGKIDLLTEIIAAPADVGIALYRVGERFRVHEWQRFMRRMGIERVAEARTRAGTRGQPSAVARYDSGKRVVGWIEGLERVVRPWDPFIRFLAEALLFDILPSLVERRERKLVSLKGQFTP